jgi:MFS family permease
MQDAVPKQQTTLRQSPIVLLMLLAAGSALSFQVWGTLLNNFAVNEAGFGGREIGTLQSIREIPGLLAVGTIIFLLMMREQTLALLSLVLLGVGTALTGYFPTALGLYATTLVMSFGFHYLDTMNQSLSLQWLPKETAAHGLGRIISADSFAALAGFGLVYAIYSVGGFGYEATYLVAGGLSIAIAVAAAALFPWFPQKTVQRREIVLRKRYSLYYALTFMDGARRQIFVVFAGFMMVQKFGYSVTEITTLFLANHLFNMFLAPQIGRFVIRFGERTALSLEYLGLALIFAAYAFVTDPWIAAALYLIDHAFFAMSMASKTYFQKIADPADISPTAAVAFSINHIAAVFLPVTLGLVWLWSPSAVFLLGAGFACISLTLARLIPARPAPGNEWIGAARGRRVQAAE